ncbi:hypothetical protein HN011_002196, partial [Eciton burchellii]
FSPPRSPQPWRGVRQSQEFAPVCPQVLPNLQEEVKPGRYEYLERHLPYLRNQSENCLYLNIYAPHQAEGERSRCTNAGVDGGSLPMSDDDSSSSSSSSGSAKVGVVTNTAHNPRGLMYSRER